MNAFFSRRVARRSARSGVTCTSAQCTPHATARSRFRTAALAVAVSTTLASGMAQATLIANETWSYANGSFVNGLNGGYGWGGAWQQINGQNTMSVSNGALVDSGGNPISADSRRMLATSVNSGVVWIGFASNFVNASGGSDQLRFTNAGVATGAFGGNGPNTAGNTGPSVDYNLFDQTLNPGGLSVDTGVKVNSGNHFTLMEFNFSTGVSTVWMDPNIANLGAGVSANFAPAFNDIDLLAKPGAQFGSLAIGTTMQDAMSAAVPEPSTYALLLAGCAVLGAATRRRSVA